MSIFTRVESDSSSELHIWHRFKQGDMQAFQALYQRHVKSLTSYGYRLTPDRQLLEDAIHDLFIDLWRRREHLTEAENTKFYLFRALRNRLLRNGRNDVFEQAEDIDGFLDYLVALSTEQQHIDSEEVHARTQRVRSAVESLSDRQKEVINLRFYHAMSLDEISELMGLSKQGVSNLLYKSYAVLRTKLSKLTILSLLVPFGGLPGWLP